MTSQELQRLQGIMKGFPTTAAQDAALLQGANKFHNAGFPYCMSYLRHRHSH